MSKNNTKVLEKASKINYYYENYEGYNNEFLKEIRKENKYTQDEVALMLNITRETYVNYEKGYTKDLGMTFILKLALIYEVEVKYIINNLYYINIQ